MIAHRDLCTCVWLASCALACTTELDRRFDGVVSCDQDGLCPAGTSCRPATNLCLPVDQGPSEVSILSREVEPAAIGPGTDVILTFTFSEPLRAPPQVQADFGGVEIPAAVESVSDDMRVFDGRLRSPDQRPSELSAATLSVVAVDALGAERVFRPEPIVVDYVPPGFDGLQWERSSAGVLDRVRFGADVELGARVSSARVLGEDGATLVEILPAITPAAGGFARLIGVVNLSELPLTGDSQLVIEATVADAAGNRTTRNSPPLVVDTAPPETVLDRTPENPSGRLRAEFSFSSPASDIASFLCSLDGEPEAPCESPFFRLLDSEGPHEFQVRAVDAAGLSDPSPARFTWLEERRWSTAFSVGHAVASDGSLWAWGDDNEGQLGLGTIGQPRNLPTRVDARVDWEEVSRASKSGCARRVDGSIWCFGGQALGTGADPSGAITPFPVPISEPGPWRTVFVRSATACALDGGNSLWCWGQNSTGTVGDGTTSPAAVPQRLSPDGRWQEARSGATFACGVRDADTGTEAYCWGETTAGDPSNTLALRGPTLLAGGDWRVVQPVNALFEPELGCGIREPGTLWCWGELRDAGGQTVFSSPSPVQISGESNWSELRGGEATGVCASREDLTLHCWVRIPPGATAARWEKRSIMTPERVFPEHEISAFDIAAGQLCALTTERELLCAGVPSQLPRGPARPRASMGTWRSLDTDDRLSCALGPSHGLWCWGREPFAEQSFPGPFDRIDRPTLVRSEAVLDATVFSSGGCIIEDVAPSTREIACWGRGFDSAYRHGDPDTLFGDPGPWSAIDSSRGSLFQEPSLCALRDDVEGTSLHCWGSNRSGNLGVGDGNPRATPTPIGTGSSYERGWSTVTLGDEHTCGIRAGELFCWGSATSGQLGLGPDTTVQLVPERVGSESDWVEVSAGRTTTCGIRSAAGNWGSLWCWGEGLNGKLGNGSVENSGFPLRVGADDGWVNVAVGPEHVCAVDRFGAVHCWGSNQEGQVDPTRGPLDVLEPVRVPDVSGATEVTVGRSHSCAINLEMLICWGQAEFGQLGDGRSFGPVVVPDP